MARPAPRHDPASRRSPVPRSRTLWPLPPVSRRSRLAAIRQVKTTIAVHAAPGPGVPTCGRGQRNRLATIRRVLVRSRPRRPVSGSPDRPESQAGIPNAFSSRPGRPNASSGRNGFSLLKRNGKTARQLIHQTRSRNKATRMSLTSHMAITPHVSILQTVQAGLPIRPTGIFSPLAQFRHVTPEREDLQRDSRQDHAQRAVRICRRIVTVQSQRNLRTGVGHPFRSVDRWGPPPDAGGGFFKGKHHAILDCNGPRDHPDAAAHGERCRRASTLRALFRPTARTPTACGLSPRSPAGETSRMTPWPGRSTSTWPTRTAACSTAMKCSKATTR